MFWKGFEKLCKTIKESIFSNVTDLFNSKSIPGLLDIQGALEGHLKGTWALQECLSSRALEGHSGTCVLEALHLADSTEDENILKSFIGLDWNAFLEESAY